ncbi:MAG: DUF4926 domain-containing protein [Crocosphaera sp.]
MNKLELFYLVQLLTYIPEFSLRNVSSGFGVGTFLTKESGFGVNDVTLKPSILCSVELTLRKGEEGAIIDDYENGVFKIEFTDKKGETTALCSIPQDQFTVVWSAKTEQWLTPILPIK